MKLTTARFVRLRYDCEDLVLRVLRQRFKARHGQFGRPKENNPPCHRFRMREAGLTAAAQPLGQRDLIDRAQQIPQDVHRRLR
jgi:hypothetical protein